MNKQKQIPIDSQWKQHQHKQQIIDLENIDYKDFNELKLMLQSEGEIQKMVKKIFDKRMKGFLNLDSKEMIIQKSQNLLISKTLDYMNIINELQTKHLKTLVRLNDMLDQKTEIICDNQNKIKTIEQNLEETENDLQNTKEQLNRKTKELEKMQIELEKIKKEQAKSLRDLEKQLSDNFEKQIKIIQNQLHQKNLQILHLETQIEETSNNLTSQINYLQTQLTNKQTQFVTLQSQYKSTIVNLKNSYKMIEQLNFNLKLLNLKIVAINNAKFKDYQRFHMHPIMIKPFHRSQMEIQCDNYDKQYLYKQLYLIQDQEQLEKMEAEEEQISESIIVKQIKLQSKQKSQQKNPQEQQSETEQLKPIIHKESSISKNSVNNSKAKGMNLSSHHDKNNILELYKEQYQKKLAQEKQRLKIQTVNLIQQMKLKYNELNNTTNLRIKMSQLKYQEIQEIYLNRFARQQDIQYITQMYKENLHLLNLCNQWEEKAQNAYQVINYYSSLVESYRNKIQIKIQGESKNLLHCEPNQQNKKLLTHTNSMNAASLINPPPIPINHTKFESTANHTFYSTTHYNKINPKNSSSYVKKFQKLRMDSSSKKKNSEHQIPVSQVLRKRGFTRQLPTDQSFSYRRIKTTTQDFELKNL